MKEKINNHELKVLILDDDAIQIDIMMEYMEMSKVPNKTVYFQNSYDVFKHIENCSNDELPKVMFIDIFMPLMDGWETLKELEPIIDTKNWDPSIFVVTSSISKIDTEKVKTQKHLKGFINKPINFKKLRSILENEYSNAFTVK